MRLRCSTWGARSPRGAFQRTFSGVRDSYNVGPSMTVAFGAFEGGLLKYWPDDDGACAVGQLPDEGAVSHETHRGLLLFDGGRCRLPPPSGREPRAVSCSCPSGNWPQVPLRDALPRGALFLGLLHAAGP